MIHFVCDRETNKIIRIFKQYKRACNMMTNLNVHILSFNPTVYPIVNEFKVGNCINEFDVERTKIF